jgi:hypothetical protein
MMVHAVQGSELLPGVRRPRLVLWVLVAAVLGLVVGLGAGGAAGFTLGKLYQERDESAGVVTPMSLDAVATQRPTVPTRCKALCKLTDSFQGAFAQAAATHQSVRLEQPAPWMIVEGYVVKASEDGQKLAQLLGDGKRHALEIEVEYPDANAEEVLITRVLGSAD